MADRPEHGNPHEGMTNWISRAEQETRAGEHDAAAAAAQIAQAYAAWHQAIKMG